MASSAEQDTPQTTDHNHRSEGVGTQQNLCGADAASYVLITDTLLHPSPLL